MKIVILGLLLTSFAFQQQAPMFVSNNPQSIYAADPNDSWNRIFRALFTRTVKARVSDAFPEGAPFSPFHIRMGSFSIRLSKEKISRTEIGDRAIEPLYPTFLNATGPFQVFSEPLFTELTAALREAINETKTRSPIERALMQADVWAAYDILYSMRDAVSPERSTKLLSLLRQFLRKLALSNDEIKLLKSNYVAVASLPNLFSTDSGWLEIELLPDRHHDFVASYRRAARVFVKPRTPPADAGQFVESLKHNQHHDRVEAVALVVQNLLIDTSGRVVPSPLFSDVQFRFFKNDATTGVTSAEPQQFELSRRKLLTEPVSGGFVEFAATYLSGAGNDYDFATPIEDAEAPVLVPLRSRCTQCHNSSLTTMMTYSIHDFPPVPTVRILKSSDQERAFRVARRKEDRDDFKSLFRAQ
ncbi:MAG TPA: hypothetical protein VFT44_21030 [Pyrinomonadaceae bacterium]|nr:hypothetical protein [Pyrinomonadaceae bacterium]